MGFNSAFKELKLFKKPGNELLNNLNDPVLNVLTSHEARLTSLLCQCDCIYCAIATLLFC